MPVSRAVRRVLLPLAATLLLLAAPSAASAHAQLEATEPAAGAVLPRQPPQVLFRFGEPVEGSLGAIRVLDHTGAAVATGPVVHPGGVGAQIAVGLRPGLPQGTYTATYRVISADGHPVSGGVVFSIGRPSASSASVSGALAGAATGPVTETVFGAARAVQYGAIAIGVGVLGFLVLLLEPALSGGSPRRRAGEVEEPATSTDEAREVARRRARTTVVAAASAGAVSAALGVVLEGAEGAGVSGWSALRPRIVGDTLDTRFGVVWAIACGCWLVVAVATLALLRPRRPGAPPVADRRLAVLVPPLVFVVLLPALAGHGSTQSPVGLLFPLISVHVAAMSVWVGGIVALLVIVPAVVRALGPDGRLPLLAAVLGRFSRVAFVAVWILAISGAIQAYVLVRHPHALIDTAYGRSVSIKTLLLIALAVVATDNHRRGVPRLRRAAAADPAVGPTAADPTPGDLATAGPTTADPTPGDLTTAGPTTADPTPGDLTTAGPTRRRLYRLIRAEAALIVVVLGVTAALSSYQPGADAAPAAPKPFSITRALGPLRMRMTVDPGRLGPNRIVLEISDPRSGRPLSGAREVDLAEALPDHGVAVLQQTAKPDGPGRFVVEGAPLSVPGTWTVDVDVLVSEFDEYTATVAVPVR